MFGTTKPELIERFDPAAVRKMALERLAKNGDLRVAHLPVIAFAALRAGLGGELRQRAQVFAEIYTRLPENCTDEWGGIARVLEQANALADARVALHRIRTTPADAEAERRWLDEQANAIARVRNQRGDWIIDGDAASCWAEAKQQLEQRKQDRVRVATADVEILQRELDDALRVVAASR